MLDNKFEVKNVNLIPEGAAEGLGKGAEALGDGLGRGSEKALISLGEAGKVIGKGVGHVPWSLGEWMRTHALQKNISKTIDLLKNKNFTKLIITCDKIEVYNEPVTLVGSLQQQEEQNLRSLVKNIVEEIAYREIHKEEIPTKLVDTDNLLAIEKAAAETSDEDLSKMWARIFVEEATHENSINKASIEILRKLDKRTAKILQDEVFPYCTDDGWFLEANDKFIPARMVASDYGILYDYGIAKTLTKYVHSLEKKFCSLDFGPYLIWGHLGYNFFTKNHLTESALHIKNILKIFPNDTHLREVANFINDEKFWHLSEKYQIKKQPAKQDYAIIIQKENMKILYPQNTYKTYMDYFSKINPNVEEKNSIQKQNQEQKHD